MATGIEHSASSVRGSATRVPGRSTRARRSSRDSAEFWAARDRVSATRLPTLDPQLAPPRVAATANLDTPDAAPAELAPRTVRRDVTSLALAFLAGLGLPVAFLVARALS